MTQNKEWFFLKGWDRCINKYRPTHHGKGAKIWQRWDAALERYAYRNHKKDLREE